MSTPPTTTLYPFDPTGKLASNLITGEQQILTAVNFRDYHFIVPQMAPYFTKSLVVKFQPVVGDTKILTEGIDYYCTYVFHDASLACATRIAGAISFNNNLLAGVVQLQYQTLGGIWTIDQQEIATILADAVYNPRVTTWEQVTYQPITFPVIDHDWDLVDLVGMSEVVNAVNAVQTAILQQASTGITAYLVNYNNPHQTTAAQTGAPTVAQVTAMITAAVTGTNGAGFAPTESPNFEGTPTAPTAPVNTDTAQIASTEFVINQASTTEPLADGTAAVGVSTMFARADHVHPAGSSTAGETVVFGSAITVSPITSGVLSLFNSAKTTTPLLVTVDTTNMTPGQTAISVVNINDGATQVVSPEGVYVNQPQVASGTAPTYQSLVSNVVPQGLWSSLAVTYGKLTTLPTSGNFTSAVFSATQTVISVNGTVVVYNPETETFGAAVATGLAIDISTTCLLNGLTSVMYMINATTGVVFSQYESVVVGCVFTISGSTVTPITLVTANVGGAPTASFVAQLQPGSFLFSIGGSTAQTTGTLIAASVSGTTLTFGTAVATGTITGTGTGIVLNTSRVAPVSTTTGIVALYAGTSSPALYVASVSGVTVTLGTPVNAANVYSVAESGYSGVVIGLSGSNVTQAALTPITVSGTTITLGSSVAIGPTVTSGTTTFNHANFRTYISSTQYTNSTNTLWKYTPTTGQFLYVANTIYPFTISNAGLITLGSVVNSAAQVTYVQQAPDGTFGYTETSSTPTTALFTVSNNVVAVGAQVYPFALANTTSSYSATYMFGRYSISGTWYTYPLVESAIPIAVNAGIPTTGGSVLTNFY
jgi:hypothetical protein